MELRKLQTQRPELGRLVPLAAPTGATHKGGSDGGSHGGGSRGQHHIYQQMGSAGSGGSGGSSGSSRLQVNGEGSAWDQQLARAATP